jgi:O-antigen/teichoic acid export membrane protein
MGRFVAVFGGATALGQLSQLLWLVAGSRVLSRGDFGRVLAAQALYGVLQLAVDNGPAFFGARLAAAGRLTLGERGRIVRLRLQLGFGAGAVALAIGAAGGGRFWAAVSTFVPALVLFAVLRYWEPFGYGDGRPWSAYLVLRSAGPALAAGVFALVSVHFPVFVPGLVECGVILVVALAFRLTPFRDVVLALRAPRGPWRGALAIGVPTVIGQLGLFAGPVLLGAFGSAAAAAIVAVGVRLITGINQIAGIIATAIFPRLASRLDLAEGRDESKLFVIGGAVVIAVVGASGAFACALPGFVVNLFLHHRSAEAETSVILAVSAAAAATLTLLATMLLIARGFERVLLRVYGAATAVTLTGDLLILRLHVSHPARWAVVALTAGQILSAAFFARYGAKFMPGIRTEIARAMWASVALASALLAAAAAASLRPYVAAVMALVAVAALVFLGWSASQGRGEGDSDADDREDEVLGHRR